MSYKVSHDVEWLTEEEFRVSVSILNTKTKVVHKERHDYWNDLPDDEQLLNFIEEVIVDCTSKFGKQLGEVL